MRQAAGEGVAFPASGGTLYLERERLGRSRTAARAAVGLRRVGDVKILYLFLISW